MTHNNGPDIEDRLQQICRIAKDQSVSNNAASMYRQRNHMFQNNVYIVLFIDFVFNTEYFTSNSINFKYRSEMLFYIF